jgi:hypothetical protein
MIIYGSRSKELAKEIVSDKCANCGTPHSIDLHLFQKYAHLFWIPVFPMGKTGLSQCDHCKQVFTLKEMPANLRTAYEHLKGQYKTPLWMFLGSFIIGGLIFAAGYSDIKKSKASAQYINHVKANDILETKTTEGHYTLMKVRNVKGDSVFVNYNKEEVILESGIDKLNQFDDYFDKEVYVFTQAELIEMFKKEDILNVVRK